MNNSNFGRWENINNLNLDKIVDMVLTNHNVDNITPSSQIFTHIGSKSENLRVLDFGSGVGRNTFALSEYSENWNILGYDNVNMISSAKEFANKKYNKNLDDFTNIKFESNWDEIKNEKFDCIVAIIVLQHISESDLDIYIKDIKNMTDKLIVVGRRSLDELNDNGSHKSVWKILEKNSLFPDFCNEPDVYKNSTEPEDHLLCIYNFKK